jgi:phage-related protein
LHKQRQELTQIHWEGDSRDVLAGFPEEVRANLGFARFEMQQGKKPSIPTWPMESIARGVYELKETMKGPGTGYLPVEGR